jgi:hypothetical protein
VWPLRRKATKKPPKENNIIKEARRYAEGLGWHVESYDVASVKKEKDRYVVFFQSRSGQEGDFFHVVVDAATGKVKNLVPGK